MRRIPTILLVDDDDTTNFLHQRLLTRLDAADQVLVATNGRKALEILSQPGNTFGTANPVLVLLDLNMPVMNGFQFLEAFQTLPLAQQEGAVVVVLTSSLSPQDLGRANALPIAGFLDKPLNQEKINTLLHRHFGPLVAAG
ncbi:response regulator [Hymenobacter sp. B1770]|uniref:response regulator n=1 Tax=Hymenobacter sp. B1770 TaxID=1718788 RepID=UPI003CF6239A